MFCSAPNKRISAQQLFESLVDLGVQVGTQDCNLIVSRYDGDMDGKLGYWEFANLFLPIDVQQRYELEQRHVVEIDDEIKFKIRRIILSIVDAENTVESIR